MRQLLLLLPFLFACGGEQCHVECGVTETVTIHLVDDATGAPLAADVTPANGVFTVDGQTGYASCAPDATTKYPSCDTVMFSLFGPHTIHIAVPGYRAIDVASDVQAQTGVCCPGPVNPLDTTVRLMKP